MSCQNTMLPGCAAAQPYVRKNVSIQNGAHGNWRPTCCLGEGFLL